MSPLPDNAQFIEEGQMKSIRLCIGSNDGENMAKIHMGDTEYFYIYDIFENSEQVVAPDQF